MAQFWPEYSRSQWHRYITAGYVMVNDEVEISSKRSLDEDDIVTYSLPVKPDFSESEIPIIFVDENVIVLDKPSGLLTHAKGVENDEFSVAEFMKSRTFDSPGSNRAGIVHRLDRDTSGVIIAAKNEEAKKFLQKQFESRKVKKEYIAVVDGTPRELEAQIDLPIERNPSSPSSFRVHSNGKVARTHYKVLSSNDKYSVVDLRPATGRTHQLRVHMNYLGTPIVGDKLYKSSHSPIGRLCLHAGSLEVTIPGGFRKVFKTPLPPDLAKFIEMIR